MDLEDGYDIDELTEESYFDEYDLEDEATGPITIDEFEDFDLEPRTLASGAQRPVPRRQGRRDIWEGEGLRVQLQRMRGVTRKGILNTPFRFQCPPLETFRIESNVGATDYSTIENGMYTRMGDRELTVITFDTLITIAPEPWVVHDGYYDYKKATTRLRNILGSKTAFRLVAWHPSESRRRGPIVELNMPVTMRSVGVEERAGEGDARYYTLSFTQWRDPVIRRRKRQRKFPIRHKLKKKDTLAKLARRYYGDPAKAGQIKTYIPKLRRWGRNTPIVKHPKYKVGDVIVIRRPLNGRDEFNGKGPDKKYKR